MKGLPRGFVLYTILNSLAHAIWYTLFPIHLRSLGYSIGQAGLTSSLPQTLSFILALPAGLVADALSVRPIFIASSLGQAVAIALIPISPSSWTVISLLTIYTFFSVLRSQSSLRAIAQQVSATRWGTGYSLYLLSVGASGAAGSYLSGFVAERMGFIPLYLISAAVFASSVFALYGFQDPHHSGRRLTLNLRTLRNSSFVSLTLSLTVHDVAIFALSPYVALYQKEILSLTPYQMGLISAASTLVSQLFQPVSGYLADRLGARITLAIHYLGTSLGYVLIGLSSRFEEVALASALQSVFLPMDMPSRRKLLSLMAGSAVATVNGLSLSLIHI